MNIRITKKDIERGKRCDANSCPVAFALKRKTHKYVEVGSHIIRVLSKGYYYRCDIPLNIQKFIYQFDSGKKVSPINFKISLKRSFQW